MDFVKARRFGAKLLRAAKVTIQSALCFSLLLHASCESNGVGTKAKPPEERRKNPEPTPDPMVAALLKRAEWASQTGAYSTALAICDRIDKRASHLAYVHFLRGQVFTELNRHEEARRAFEKVVEINPAFPAIRLNLGNNAAQRGKYHEALTHYQAEQASTLPDDPLVKKRATLLQMGRVYRELGEIEEALAAFQRLVQLDENDDEAYDELGQIYQNDGEFENALKMKMRALELNPENGDYAYYIGTLLFKLGRPQEAIAYLEKAKEKRPWFYGAYYNLGRSLLAVGRIVEGKRYLAIVDSMQNRNSQLGVAKTTAKLHATPDRWLSYADMLYQDKRFEEALEAYQVASSLNPRDSTATQAVLRLRRLLAKR